MSERLRTSSRVERKTSGRPREFVVEEALDAAMEVFAAKGYAAASLSDLTSAMGINRVSMYAAFGNKEALFVKAMIRYTELGNERFARCLADCTAREGFERLVRESVRMFTDRDAHGVCFVTQGPLAKGDASIETRRFVASKRAEIETMLKKLLDRALADDELARDVSTADLARAYTVMIQGMALEAQHGATRDQLLRVVDLAMTMWPDRRSTRRRSASPAAR